MAIYFHCEQCGHRVKAEDSHAGRRARCAHCGHKMRVPGTRVTHHRELSEDDDSPEVEFRLAPMDDEPEPPPRLIGSVERSELELQSVEPASKTEAPPRLDPNESGPRFGAVPVEIPEELLSDRAPIPLDPNFVPAPLSVGHGSASPMLISARGKMYRGVKWILKKLEWIENWLYLVSVASLMVAIVGLLMDLDPLAHFGAVWVVLTSLALVALGGIEVIIKPFQLGVLGTSWKTMKKQIRHALAAFIPLLILIASYFFIKPIRDYFLDTAEARQLKQMSSVSAPDRDRRVANLLLIRR